MVRKAEAADLSEIAEIITVSFLDDFKPISRNKNKVKRFFESCLSPAVFYVYEEDGVLLGVTALSDYSSGRAIKPDKKQPKEAFGFFRGTLFNLFVRKHFEEIFCHDYFTALVEFVAVRPEARGRGLSGKMLERILADTEYRRYLLDVKDNNLPAVKTYQRLGFSETRREKAPKKASFSYVVFMRYDKAAKNEAVGKKAYMYRPE